MVGGWSGVWLAGWLPALLDVTLVDSVADRETVSRSNGRPGIQNARAAPHARSASPAALNGLMVDAQVFLTLRLLITWLIVLSLVG
jgi:hypothetical protein